MHHCNTYVFHILHLYFIPLGSLHVFVLILCTCVHSRSTNTHTRTHTHTMYGLYSLFVLCIHAYLRTIMHAYLQSIDARKMKEYEEHKKKKEVCPLVSTCVCTLVHTTCCRCQDGYVPMTWSVHSHCVPIGIPTVLSCSVTFHATHSYIPSQFCLSLNFSCVPSGQDTYK